LSNNFRKLKRIVVFLATNFKNVNRNCKYNKSTNHNAAIFLCKIKRSPSPYNDTKMDKIAQ